MTRNNLGTVTVLVGGRQYDKPYDPRCAVCISPWMGEIDGLLADGWTYASIRNYIAHRRPAGPPLKCYGPHIAHLAPPHLAARRGLERAVTERGQDQDGEVPLAQLSDLTSAAMQRVWEAMARGEIQPSLRDVVAAMKYQHSVEQDKSGAASAEQFQAALIEIYEITRRHLTPAGWAAFTREIYGSEAILAVLGRPQPSLTVVPTEETTG